MAAQPRAVNRSPAHGATNGRDGQQPLLDVKGLKTQFFTQDGVVKAVDDVTFHVMPGETLGVVGESGCGKSMTGLSIMRLIPNPPGKIVAGEIVFDGRDILRMSDDQVRSIRGNDIAMIFQDPMTSLNPVLTINRQISEALELHMGMNKSQAKRRTIELLAMVGIPNAEERVDQYPHQFSGGMRQRVMIAMALSCNPKLLIADEPTTALDVTIQAQILDLMRTLQTERDTGVIMITHSMGVVAGMADRIQVMYAGHIVETASTEEIFANPRHPYTVGLMKSIPRLDATRKSKLEPIRGLPPDLIDLPDMCPFVPRCNYAREKCEQKNPPLLEVAAGHYSACWFWEEVSKEDDQTAVARALGHPEPTAREDFSDRTALPGTPGVVDPMAPAAETSRPTPADASIAPAQDMPGTPGTGSVVAGPPGSLGIAGANLGRGSAPGSTDVGDPADPNDPAAPARRHDR